MIAPDATRVFVLKGGPGVGKSTFMRKIGEEMRARGYNIEHHHCSSDNNSLDGLVIPALGVGLLDGTAPHVVDPQIPGAVSEIIHLGDYWDEAALRADKDSIVAAHRRLGRRFQIAYSQLAEAKVIRDEMESYVTEAMDFTRVDRLTAELTAQILEKAPPRNNGSAPRARHLFYSAISPNGVVHYLDSLLAGLAQLYLIRGRPGSGRSTLVETVARAAHARGLDTAVYHCAFEPHRVDLVIIPAVRTAVLKDVEEIGFIPAADGPRVDVYNLDVYLNEEGLASYRTELAAARERFAAALNRAIGHIAQAKQLHDHLESFYIPAMDFAAVERKREEILNRILGYAAAMKS